MDRGASEDVPVLIVGGSLVGLAAALFLRWHGVDVLAVERHAGTAINARAGHFHLRTVQILRSAGLEDAVRRKSQEQYPPDGGINNVESLAGREIANYFPNLNAGVDEFSPTVRLFINQDALEPILRARAAGLGARLRYRTECTSLEQDAGGASRFFPREQLALSTQCGFASAGPGHAISEDAQQNTLHLVAEVADRVWRLA
jgi:2-polyprenyl-6-methoxyphenol hydroxylase-like FAD-dependent oxidoreductase